MSAAFPGVDRDTPRRCGIMSRVSGCDLYARASCPSGVLGWREVRGGCSRRRYRAREGPTAPPWAPRAEPPGCPAGRSGLLGAERTQPQTGDVMAQWRGSPPCEGGAARDTTPGAPRADKAQCRDAIAHRAVRGWSRERYRVEGAAIGRNVRTCEGRLSPPLRRARESSGGQALRAALRRLCHRAPEPGTRAPALRTGTSRRSSGGAAG